MTFAGDSAGGNLATAVSLSLMKKKIKPKIALQVSNPLLELKGQPAYHVLVMSSSICK